MKKSTLPLRRDNFHVRASLRIRDSLRIVGAIAAKDIVDALKNKTTVTTIFTVVFLMLFYRFMPMLESGDVLPRAAVYDLGNSGLVTGLENSTDVYVRQLDSQDQMEAYVADENLVVMGLTIPAGFDETVEAGGPAVLEGYTVHWASEDDIVETKALFEQQLSQSAGRPVTINLDGNTVYTRPDSRGAAFMAAVSLIVAVTMIGVFMTSQLILEEKKAKTLDALLVSPATAGQVVMGKVVSGLFYCLLVGAIVLAFNANLVTNWGLAILLLIVGSLFAVGLGLLLGTAVNQQQQLRLWGFILFQPLLLPIFLAILGDILPETVLNIFEWIPTVALSTAIRASFAESGSINLIVPQLAVIAVSTALLLAAAAWLVRRSDH